MESEVDVTRVVKLDGERWEDEASFHRAIAEQLEFPDWYGANPSALWDLLTAWVELPLRIEWSSYAACEQRWGEDAAVLRSVLEDAAAEVEGLEVVILSGAAS